MTVGRTGELPWQRINLPEEDIRVTVVQLSAGGTDGDTAALRRVERVAREAAQASRPDILVLPDALSGAYAGGRRAEVAPAPVDGAVLQLLIALADELGCAVTGGFHGVNGAHAHQMTALVERDGAVHLQTRDRPDAAQFHLSRAGSGHAYCSTGSGPVALMSGAELVSATVARRVRADVRLVLGGASWRSLAPRLRVGRGDVERALEAPGRLARCVGAPVAVAHHVAGGRLGASQIVAADGRLLARVAAGEEGWVSAELTLTAPVPLDAVPNGAWLEPAGGVTRAMWQLRGAAGRVDYRRRHARGRLPWQSVPPVPERPQYTPPPGQPVDERRDRTAVVPGS